MLITTCDLPLYKLGEITVNLLGVNILQYLFLFVFLNITDHSGMVMVEYYKYFGGNKFLKAF